MNNQNKYHSLFSFDIPLLIIITIFLLIILLINNLYLIAMVAMVMASISMNYFSILLFHKPKEVNIRFFNAGLTSILLTIFLATQLGIVSNMVLFSNLIGFFSVVLLSLLTYDLIKFKLKAKWM